MICIVQARMSSNRLPGKILKKINKMPSIKILVNSLKRSKLFKKVIVATSNQDTDKRLVEFCKKNNLNLFLGSLNNVYERLFTCAINHQENYFVRISGDSPFMDVKIIKKLLLLKNRKKNYDIYTNVFPRTFPKGQSIEIIKTDLIKKVKNLRNLDKEHVTTYFYRNYKNFKIINLKNKIDQSHLNLCIDKEKDLLYFRKILKEINLNKYIDYNKILSLMSDNEKN